MIGLMVALAVALIPFLAVSGALKLMERRQGRRDRTVATQIMLTDAIHWELGAVAAPTVSRRRRGGWRVSMAVPVDRPAMVAAILRVTTRFFADKGLGEHLEIVLAPDRFSVRQPASELPRTGRRGAAGVPIAA